MTVYIVISFKIMKLKKGQLLIYFMNLGLYCFFNKANKRTAPRRDALWIYSNEVSFQTSKLLISMIFIKIDSYIKRESRFLRSLDCYFD